MENTRERQLAQLEILKKVAKICDENGIEYMLACGSLLGAIRHKGFIPWDDDIDIYMTVENYIKFLKNGQKLLGDRFFIQNWKTDKCYSELWTQVRMNGTTSMPLKLASWKIHFGIHIDIFPIIGISEKKKKKQLAGIKWSRMLLAKDYMKAIGEKAKGKQKLINCLPRFMRRLLCYMLESTYMLSPNKHEKSTELWYKMGDVFPSYLFFHFRKILFEDNYFKTMEDTDTYLKLEYGDYMTPPPESERGGHASTIGKIIRDVNKDYKEYQEEYANNRL